MRKFRAEIWERFRKIGLLSERYPFEPPTPIQLWMGERTGVSLDFLDSTPDMAYPALPRCAVCFAPDVFEHLHDPLRVLRGLDAALLPGGFLATDVKDHELEYMHVSPDLTSLRRKLEILGNEEIHPSALSRKGPKRHRAAMSP